MNNPISALGHVSALIKSSYLVIFHLGQGMLQRLKPSRAHLRDVGVLETSQALLGPSKHCVNIISIDDVAERLK